MKSFETFTPTVCAPATVDKADGWGRYADVPCPEGGNPCLAIKRYFLGVIELSPEVVSCHYDQLSGKYSEEPSPIIDEGEET